MQSCADEVSIGEDLISPQVVEERYSFHEFLGEGASGAVYKVIDKERNQVMAMKIGYYMKDIYSEEIYIGCLINALLPFTDSFLPLVDWALVDALPFEETRMQEQGLRGITWTELDEEESPTYAVLVSPLLIAVLDSPPPDLNRTEVAFELVYGYLVADRELGFLHGDIHSMNIGFLPGNFSRVYQLKARKILVESKYQPVYLDYGKSILRKDSSEAEIEDTLFEDIMSLIGLISRQMKLSVLSEELDKTPYSQWPQLLAMSQTFNSLEIQEIPTGEAIKIYTPIDF
jgi:hypothetical protein